MQGIGEKFSPDPHTGTGNFTIPLAMPGGRNRFQPQLNLIYSTGNGNGVFGLGWTLNVPGVTRKTSQGIPRYRDDAADLAERDTFVLSGAEDLVPLGVVNDETSTQATLYRPRTEGLFAEILRYRSPTYDYWRVRSKDGLLGYYGTNPAAGECPAYPPPGSPAPDPAIVSKPGDLKDVFRWHLTMTKDPFGNRIEYLYGSDSGDEPGHRWTRPILRCIRYGDYGDPANPQFLVTVTFEYEDRPDAFSEYRAGFEIRTAKRCKAILIQTHADRDYTVRRYDIEYGSSGFNGLSLLTRLHVVGFDDAGNEGRELPPVDFGYTRFHPEDQTRRDFYPVRGELSSSLANPNVDLVDLFGNGLPDILEMNGAVRYWRNLGNGRFDVPRPMQDAPAGFALSDAGVQLLDADGDGRTDLLVTQPALAGYFPLRFGARWDRDSMRKYRTAPTFSMEDPEVRLVDLTGNGVTDAVRSGARLECFFNNPQGGWQETRWVERLALDAFPNVNFSDPRVRLDDMTGDRLQDIVLLYDGNVEYWPNLGYGDWGVRIHMRNSPRFPWGYDPRRILLGDVDGDGLADIVYVDDRRIHLWLNNSGNSWSDEIIITGTPPVSDMDAVRLTDLVGSGVAGILWTKDAAEAGEDHYFFVDLTGGTKPYVLSDMDNNMGAVTRVTYAPSTKFHLDDERDWRTRWKTPLPFPVPVVSRVEVADALSFGKLTTDYRYHHGYWDGLEREFRGFGMVEQLDTQSFDEYAGSGLPRDRSVFADLDRALFSPPTLTKTWFHQGAVEDEEGNWSEAYPDREYWQDDPHLLDHPGTIARSLAAIAQAHAALMPLERRRIERDALRSLRGSVLRTELYALDGSSRESRPYSVTERAYDVLEVPAPAAQTARAPRVFFPHLIAERSTQWERGDDPKTNVAYTSDYDGFGNPLTLIQVACPRRWRRLDDALRGVTYLATVTRTEIASPQSPGVYIHDRVARAAVYEIVNAPVPDTAPVADGRTLRQVVGLASLPASLRVFAESLNFYDGDPTVSGRLEFVGLPFGLLGRYGAVARSEALVLTDDILDEAYGAATPPYLTRGQLFTAGADYPQGYVDGLPPLAGYVFHDAGVGAPYSGGYYITTQRTRFDFHGTGPVRGLVLARRDPVGIETRIDYDQPYNILPAAITDAAQMRTETVYNYRVLQPRLLIDANGNRSRVDFSPGGLVTATWMMGKENEGEGDIARPSSTVEYGFRAFMTSRQANPLQPSPAFIKTVRYTHHDSDSDDAGARIEARQYSDGFGRVLQTRTQTDAVRFGDTLFGGGDAVLPAQQSDGWGGDVNGIENTDADNPNVVVTGWQRYDNKGRVIERYEPFYSSGWDYTRPTDSANPGRRGFGAKVSTFFDPRGQVVRTLNPNRSEQRIVYGVPRNLDDPSDPEGIDPSPWVVYTYDANDNAGRTHGGQSSAYRHHWNTPSSILIDALGRTVLSVTRNRAKPAQAADPLPAVVEYRTHSRYDIQGNLLEVTDALNRTACRYVYDLAAHPLRIESIDAGWRAMVLDAMEQEVERWDGKGSRILRSYDVLRRADRVWARNAGTDALTLRERVFYGDGGTPNQAAVERTAARAANLLGRRARQLDEAGEVTFSLYDFKGNLREKTRAVIADAPLVAALDAPGGPARGFTVDWESPPALDGAYQTSIDYDALNRVRLMQYPRDVDGTRKTLTPAYSGEGCLMRLTLDGETFVERIAYNAKGQRVLVAYGNGLMTRYAYDPQTFRLVRMRTEGYKAPSRLVYRPVGDALQDFAYDYDLAGNPLAITERTRGCGVRNNPRALEFPDLTTLLGAGDALVCSFTYDPLYRLTSATGREANNIPTIVRPLEDAARDGFNWGGPGTPNPDTARDSTRIYTESYVYDAVDNLLTIGHGSWTRHFGMSGFAPGDWAQEWPTHLDPAVPWPGPTNNRLTHVGEGQLVVPQSHFFDGNGNVVREHTDRHFAWDAADRLLAFANRASGANASVEACYLYDSAGRRTKKLVRRNMAAVEATVYIDGVFEHRRNSAGQNNTLHLMDDKHRVATLRAGPALGDSGPAAQYHFGDHLASTHAVVGGADASAATFVNREEYFPYGETSFGSFGRKRYRYVGKERDEESGLIDHGARHYAPWLGRWTSCDPAGPQDALQLYCFVRCNPMALIDPSGSSSTLSQAFLSGAGKRATATLSSMADAIMLNTATFGMYGIYQLATTVSEAYREGGGGGYGVLNAVNSLNPVNTLLTQGWLANDEAGQALYLESLGDIEGARAHAAKSGAAFTDYTVGAVELGMTMAGGVKVARKLGVPGTKQPAPVPTAPAKSKGQILKEITKKHNDAADKLASELQKTGSDATHSGGKTIKGANGKSIKGTEGTATTRKPDVVADTDAGTKKTGIEVKTSDSPDTVQKAADQLANEASFEGKGFFDEKPWTIGEGSGVAYVRYGILSVFKADTSKN